MIKPLMIAITLAASTSSFAQGGVTPLDIEFGYWESKSEIIENDMMNAILSQMPADQQAQIRAMVQSSMLSQTAKQCFSKETFENFEAELKKAIGGKSDCSMEVLKSTNKELIGTLKCNGRNMEVTTKVVNRSLVESTLIGADSTKIKVLSRFVSNQCPVSAE